MSQAQKYNFRLRFHLPGQNCIDSDAEELVILEEESGVAIRLRSGARGTPIKSHSRAAIIGGPYSTREDAHSAAERAKRSLLVWAVRSRCGIDLGGRPPRGILTADGREYFEKQLAAPVRADVHGIDVYECVEGLVFLLVNADASLGTTADAFVAQIKAAFAVPVALSEKQELAGEILSASYFDASDRSRFITLITAVEALLDPLPRPVGATQVVNKMVQVLEDSELDGLTRDSMRGSLRWLNYDSIGQTGKALAGRLLPEKVYDGLAASQFFGYCYELRSRIVHDGKLPGDLSDFPTVCAAAHSFVCDLLVASFAEAAGNARDSRR